MTTKEDWEAAHRAALVDHRDSLVAAQDRIHELASDAAHSGIDVMPCRFCGSTRPANAWCTCPAGSALADAVASIERRDAQLRDVQSALLAAQVAGNGHLQRAVRAEASRDRYQREANTLATAYRAERERLARVRALVDGKPSYALLSAGAVQEVLGGRLAYELTEGATA